MFPIIKIQHLRARQEHEANATLFERIRKTALDREKEKKKRCTLAKRKSEATANTFDREGKCRGDGLATVARCT